MRFVCFSLKAKIGNVDALSSLSHSRHYMSQKTIVTTDQLVGRVIERLFTGLQEAVALGSLRSTTSFGEKAMPSAPCPKI